MHAARFHPVWKSALLHAGLALFALVVSGSVPAAPLAPAQVTALTAFFSSSNGTAWTTHTNWANGGDPCDGAAPWFGVTCDAGGDNVVGIDLYNNNVSGTLASLDAFTALETFNVNQNALTGSLPSLAGLGALQQFSANNNQLTGGIPALTGLPALVLFDVSANQLTGPIPALDQVPSLQTFYVFANQLTGLLPSLSNLSVLSFFRAEFNQLTGPMPSLAGNPILKQMSLANNQLTGSPPAAPATLQAGLSSLCPNNFSLPSASDSAWNTATTGAAWWTGGPGNCWADITPSVTSAPSTGTITPDSVQTPVAPIGPGGATTVFNLAPAAGYVVDTVVDTCGNGGALSGSLSGTAYSITGPHGNCTVKVAFRPLAGPGAGAGSGGVASIPTLGESALMALALLMAGSFAWRGRKS